MRRVYITPCAAIGSTRPRGLQPSPCTMDYKHHRNTNGVPGLPTHGMRSEPVAHVSIHEIAAARCSGACAKADSASRPAVYRPRSRAAPAAAEVPQKSLVGGCAPMLSARAWPQQ